MWGIFISMEIATASMYLQKFKYWLVIVKSQLDGVSILLNKNTAQTNYIYPINILTTSSLESICKINIGLNFLKQNNNLSFEIYDREIQKIFHQYGHNLKELLEESTLGDFLKIKNIKKGKEQYKFVDEWILEFEYDNSLRNISIKTSEASRYGPFSHINDSLITLPDKEILNYFLEQIWKYTNENYEKTREEFNNYN